MRVKAICILLALCAAGCAGGRQIFHVAGCNERLALPYKRMECRACVERPIPHEYLPDNPDGARCVLR
jgi:hypothetical protein